MKKRTKKLLLFRGPANADQFAPARPGGLGQLYAYAALGTAAAIFFLALFLHIPIGTEAREYVFYRGFLAQIGGWIGLIYPVGANWRIVSMAVFAASRDICGFGATCLNTIQIAQLLLCMVFGTIHLHQLLRRPVLVASCMALWCFSLPVFSAGLWQGTQHDKLAFLFSLAALSLGLSALRRQLRGAGLIVTTLVLLALFCLALNAKEIAFFLPAAAIAQVLLLGPQGTMRDRILAGRVYALPVLYAFAYIAIYMLRLTSPFQNHVMGGGLSTNARFYFLSLMGRQESSALVAGVALAVLVAAGAWISLSASREGLRVLAYLAVVFGANMVLVAGAAYPQDFYLLLAQWAFLALAATAGVLLQRAAGVARYAGLGALSLLLAIFLHKRIGDVVGWGPGEVLREAHMLDADYARLRPRCGAPMAHGLKLVFPSRPLGAFYFFRGGTDDPEQLLAPFICEAPIDVAMTYAYDGVTTVDRAGELLVVFNSDLSLHEVTQK